MNLWYRLAALPDFSRAYYPAIGINGPGDALAALDDSLRPLHRLLVTTGAKLHLVLTWNPQAQAGLRLDVLFGFTADTATTTKALAEAVDKLLFAIPLGVAYGAVPALGTESLLQRLTLADNEPPPCVGIVCAGEPLVGVQIAKGARYREPHVFNAWVAQHAQAGDDPSGENAAPSHFQTVGTVKSNGSSRLISLLHLMAALNQRAVFNLTLAAADYSVQLEQDYAWSLHALRQFKAQQFGGGAGLFGAKFESRADDTVADEILRDREETLDTLRNTGTFQTAIQCWAEDLATAQLMADTALADAVQEGACLSAPLNIAVALEAVPACGLIARDGLPTPHTGVHPGLPWLPYVFSIEEVQGFFRFPTLFDGERLELARETDPPRPTTMTGGATPAALRLGLRDGAKTRNKAGADSDTDAIPYALWLPLANLPKHTLVAGVPGAGKSNTLMALAYKAKQAGIPFLILEPAKREYRSLAHLDSTIKVFAPGRVFPGVAGMRPPLFQINPFEVPRGVALAEHVAALVACFEGGLNLFAPLPTLLERALYNVYQTCGWQMRDLATDSLIALCAWPTMGQLVDELTALGKSTVYKGENAGTIQGALDSKFKRLKRGESMVGDVFDCALSSVAPEEWLQVSAVVELESLGADYGNFLALVLMTTIRSVLGVSTGTGGKVRHLLVLEEAHNLIGPSSHSSGIDGGPKAAATALVAKLLAEVRALGQGIVIADQQPSALAPDVVKNTSLKICHRLVALDERETMGDAMMASGEQMEALALLPPGRALAFFEGLQKPFFLDIDLADERKRHLQGLNDVALAELTDAADESGQASRTWLYLQARLDSILSSVKATNKVCLATGEWRIDQARAHEGWRLAIQDGVPIAGQEIFDWQISSADGWAKEAKHINASTTTLRAALEHLDYLHRCLGLQDPTNSGAGLSGFSLQKEMELRTTRDKYWQYLQQFLNFYSDSKSDHSRWFEERQKWLTTVGST